MDVYQVMPFSFSIMYCLDLPQIRRVIFGIAFVLVLLSQLRQCFAIHLLDALGAKRESAESLLDLVQVITDLAVGHACGSVRMIVSSNLARPFEVDVEVMVLIVR